MYQILRKPFFLTLALCLTSVLLRAQSAHICEDSGKYYNVNGAKIWVVTVGSGDPVFLIPGGPGSAHVYMRALDSLCSSNKLVYYDGFGRGRSDTAKNVKEYSIDRDISDLEQLRIALGFNKISVIGHSYGTIVAQGYAIKYPAHVSHLILLAPFHSHDMWQENDDNCNREIKCNYPEVWDSLTKLRNKGYRSHDSIHQEVYSQVPYGFFYAYNPENFTHPNRDYYPNRFNEKLYYQLVGPDGDFKVTNDIGKFDFRDKLKALNMPVLIIAGRFDRVAVPWMAIKYKEYCPQAKFYIFEKSGHNPYIEEAAKILKTIREFLAQ